MAGPCRRHLYGRGANADATMMWHLSIGAVGPNRTTVFSNSLPVFFLDESLHLDHVVGAGLVCAGITLVVARGPTTNVDAQD
jgi:drug/metabolite transporter (DMT)-like permease